MYDFTGNGPGIAVVGWSCRLPGANSISELWSLLSKGRCAISRVPADRFSLDHFSHPRRQERGRTYTWAAGVLDDIWGFDPGIFGISPREAQQMDPQQRILLQLTWEALEDAGIRPSSISGKGVGVYVGASQTEYAQPFFGDPAIGDTHFATGNSLAVLSNRISYIFDTHGPSMTIDTACSSSLVALHEACEALRSGRIETAIVGGINIIAAPTSFIFFSQAAMLSPTGLCRAFSADADGFVRAEGAGVLVLRSIRHARNDGNPVRGIIAASDVNSDGRTSGIALPSADAQLRLLRTLYSRAEIDATQLAFIEAHGTGTPAGDPIEAYAIGHALARHRAAPLPIGSIKTNIGHLEPASGLAGVLKALLALEHGVLPPTINYARPNPNIDLDELNIAICREPMLLPQSSHLYAGVNSFGFGGTNAHVILERGSELDRVPLSESGQSAEYMVLSAQTKPALKALASKYIDCIAGLSSEETAVVAAAAAHRRDRLASSLVITSTRHDVVAESLEAFVADHNHPALTFGETIGSDLPIAFVYSGNGGQWVGMGCSAYRHNASFRSRFDDASKEFERLAGWSLREALFDEKLADRINLTSVAQPLIFAIQIGATAAMRARGLSPVTALGHSVGEIAAAEATGVFDLPTAVRVIYCRSRHQELVRHAGRMVAVLASAEAVEALANQVGEVEIAAYNSARAVTVAGPTDALARFTRLAKRNGLACLDLKLDYPFHTEMMAPVEAPLVADLAELQLRDGAIPFVSTVDAMVQSGLLLNAHYWWRNVRQPVQFAAAVREAAKLGARCFVEIGPRGLLGKHIADSLSGDFGAIASLCVLDRDTADEDPFERAVAKALVAGAKIDAEAVVGSDPGGRVALPTYPWQQRPFRYAPTTEAIGWFNCEYHPLSGARYAGDALEWHGFIDTAVLPELADHRVGAQIILPGTAFVEIALSVARQWLRGDDFRLTDCEILAPLDLTSGETREVLSRVSPGSQTIEILSRPRLSAASWVTHVKAKVVRGTNSTPTHGTAIPPSGGDTVGRDKLYQIADACGLHYGPAFSMMEAACLHDNNLISIQLSLTNTKNIFLLDPLRLDCCAHAVILLFPGLRAEERGVAYVPVRLDEVILYRPGSVPSAALIAVKATSERSILTDMSVFSADGDVIAVLRGVRSQAIPVRRNGSLESFAFVERLAPVAGELAGEAGIEAEMSDFAAAARALGLVSNEHSAMSEATRMIEGWATMAAFEIASTLADNNVVHPDLLINENHWTAGVRSWLVALLERLGSAQLAKQSNGVWTLVKDPQLPSSASIVRTLAVEYPARVAELMLAAEITAFAERLAQRSGTLEEAAQLSAHAIDFYDVANRSRHDAAEVLVKVLRATKSLWPKQRALRVLLIGFSPLAFELAKLKEAEAHVTVLECDRRQFERGELAVDRSTRVRVIDQLNDEDGAFDLVVAAEAMHRLTSAITICDLLRSLAPGGVFAAVEPRPTLFRDLVFGLRREWADTPTYKPPRSASDWTAELQRAGFTEISVANVTSGADRALLIVGKKTASANEAAPGPASDEEEPLIRLADTAGPSKLAEILTERLRPRGRGPDQANGRGEIGTPSAVIYIPTFQNALADPLDALSRRCLEIKGCAERIGSERVTLWLVFEGALPNDGREFRPVETGAWAFARTLANEFAHLDVRKIDVATGVPPDVAADRIVTIVRSATNETELQIEQATIRAVRVESLTAAERDRYGSVPAARLERGPTAGQRLIWQPIERRPPGPDEVEIAVAATGLNFRDVMYMLGLLPDDILEGGLTGPTLGLECAGTVVATGAAVKTFNIGDRVAAFAPSAFSTHVSVSAGQVMKIPDSMTLEAAATIPVAFLTGYYSLVSLANLRRDEWLLVHGGAGAVGMAAIQIAQARGAKIIATAGTSSKRDLLRALGVAHVLDSRSTRFVDEVREITGSGVDVVLNSLAGEAMERSIACLTAFGRFIELGKRDFVANTHIGLRPLRKNLSYFAVDVDQLMVGRPEIAHEVFSEIWRQFADGSFTPLPHCTFSGAEIAGAFQLMQQSGHVGKIVVRPPELDAIRASQQKFVIDPAATHLVTGGFGGFGLATARWLADRGARHLVLVGRRGAERTEAQDLIADLSRHGVVVRAEKCDIADAEAVETLFGKIRDTMPRLAGVIHSAMVLDDAVIENLDAARLDRVLEPKVRGAMNLDRATQDLDLDYFVLYSSVTTLIGNPGQANYVAANAFMEGLARRRRQQGLPALAIGWGPISDVGVVARTEKLQTNMQKIGARGMMAREALELMAQALGEAADLVDDGVITVAPYDSALRSELLPVLKSPTYTSLISRRHGEVGLNDKIDLRALLETNDIEAVRQTVADAVVAELARVLHFREEDVNRVRPLADLGLDSLMALELAMNLEERFGVRFTLGGSAADLTVTSVTNEIIAQVSHDDGPRDDVAAIAMAEQHLENVGKEQVELLTALMESERPKIMSVQS